MDDTEPLDGWLARIFLNERHDGVPPPRRSEAILDRDLEKLGMEGSKAWVFDDRLVVSKITP